MTFPEAYLLPLKSPAEGCTQLKRELSRYSFFTVSFNGQLMLPASVATIGPLYRKLAVTFSPRRLRWPPQVDCPPPPTLCMNHVLVRDPNAGKPECG
jgi:hypothetical protein